MISLMKVSSYVVSCCPAGRPGWLPGDLGIHVHIYSTKAGDLCSNLILWGLDMPVVVVKVELWVPEGFCIQGGWKPLLLAHFWSERGERLLSKQNTVTI